jgi:small subunit ribosomal protein S6
MPFYIRVPSLITPVHCITQTEEPQVATLERAMGLSDEVILYLTLKLDRVVAPPADLSPLTEIPPSPITEAVVEDDGISAED